MYFPDAFSELLRVTYVYHQKNTLEEAFDIAIDMIGEGRPDLANVRPVAGGFDVYVHDNFLFSIPRDGSTNPEQRRKVKDRVITDVKTAINRHYQEDILVIDKP